MNKFSDIAEWLRAHSLERYIQAFEANEIDLRSLPDLTDEDLRELGLPIGPRRLALRAIRALQPPESAAVRPDVPRSSASSSPARPTEQLPKQSTAPTVPRARQAPPAERRQLTVLFCDMVGSSALSNRLDPEEQREVVGAFQACCASVVQRLGGMVAQYLGDGVLAYFGYPAAHEDDAERAVRAGLSIVEAVGGLRPAQGVAPRTRIGIATGLVVVGDLVREGVTQQNAAIGATTNLAARLQALAEPNTVVIAQDTQRLLGSMFELCDLGAHALKGFDEPVRVHRVLGTGKVEDRFEARHPAGLLPLLGREEELEILLRRWEQARQGNGRVVLLTGEPGIGKSRLTRELRERLLAEPFTPLYCHCSPHHRDSALHPIIGHLVHASGIERDDTADRRLDKLRALLAPSSDNLERDMALFAALLSIPTADRYPAHGLTPQQLKERTLEALLGQVARLSERQPMLMIFEDLHWIDPTSLDLLSRIVEAAPRHRLLVIATARPEFASPWPNHRHVSTLSLSRLDRAQSEALVARTAGGLPDAVVAQIVARTDGIPLFVEELTKTILESGLLREVTGGYELTGPLPTLAIPSTLHASLLARLDRLAAVKDVAQIGSVIGREFPYSMLAAVAALPEADLRSALERLVTAELLFQRGEPPDASYSFKHALVQDAAYTSLVRSRRQQLHGRIAEAIKTQFPDIAETSPEMLAHHYSEAGFFDDALHWWREAGQRAIQRSANLEAVAHLTKGIALLAAQPDAAALGQQELALQVLLGPALMATKGVAAAETMHAYVRARELCQQRQETPPLSVLWGLWYFYNGRGEHGPARELADELLAQARVSTDRTFGLVAHRAAGNTAYHIGDLTACQAHLEQGMALYVPELHGPLMFQYGQDIAVTCRAWCSLALWLLGYPDRARECSRQALVIAQTAAHLPSTAYALIWAAMLHRFCRDDEAAQRCAAEGIALCSEHGFSVYLAWATSVSGSVLSHRGEVEEGLSRARKGMALLSATRVGATIPYHMSMLAEACARAGQCEEGLDLLAEALAMAEAKGEHNYRAEIFRLRGEIAMQRNPDRSQDVEACFEQAIAIARGQQARSLELRATTSLARFWLRKGRAAEAGTLLAPIYGWFTEGFDTADLKEAKALLDHLKGASPE